MQAAGLLISKIYGVYYLKFSIADRYNRPVDFIRLFVTIDRNTIDNPILLSRPSLQSLAIVLDNEIGEWEFK